MDLGELISLHKGDRSYATLERDCGGAPRAARLQQLATAPLKNFPDPPTIQALARGLRVSERAVVLAAASSLGLSVGDVNVLVDRLPDGARDLSEDQIATVVDMVRRLVEANERAGFVATFETLLLDERALILGADGSPLEGDARAEKAREVAEELVGNPTRLRQLANQINDAIDRIEKGRDGNADDSPSTSQDASVTSFPKRQRMLEDASTEVEAARRGDDDNEPPRNQSEKHGGSVSGFDPDED